MASSRVLPSNPTISRINLTGAGGAYTSWAAWEGDTDVDHVTGEFSDVLEIEKGVYLNIFSALSMTSTAGYDNATYTRVVKCVDGHSYLEACNGVPAEDGSCVVLETNATGNTWCLLMNSSYAQLWDVALKCTTGATAGRGGLRFGISNITAIGVYVIDIIKGGAGATGRAFDFGNVGDCKLIHCICQKSFNDGITSQAFVGTNYLYNCIIRGCTDNALEITTEQTFVTKNCIFEQTVSVSGTHTQTTNLTSAPTYVDAANGDLHIAYNDATAKRQGTSLAADAVFPFDNDADGHIRTQAWDIGAFQYHWGKNIRSGIRGRDQLKKRSFVDVEDIKKVSFVGAR